MTDMREENVVQPLLVSLSAIKQAAECVRAILKIDDIVSYSILEKLLGYGKSRESETQTSVILLLRVERETMFWLCFENVSGRMEVGEVEQNREEGEERCEGREKRD